MKRIFQKWLLLVVTGAFVMTFAFLWYYQSELAKESAENTLRIKLEDAKAEIKRTQNNLKAINDARVGLFRKIRSFA